MNWKTKKVKIRDEHGAGGIKSAGARESANKTLGTCIQGFSSSIVSLGVSATSTRGVAFACAKAIRDPSRRSNQPNTAS